VGGGGQMLTSAKKKKKISKEKTFEDITDQFDSTGKINQN
jgi:hypothetical protein